MKTRLVWLCLVYADCDGEGNLYGTTYQGGASDRGAVFELDASGRFDILFASKAGPRAPNPLPG
jgi:uncharacterized repeat protein (TIGR03803 family)